MSETPISRRLAFGRVASCALGFAACVFGFFQIAARHDDFVLPQLGVTTIPELELVFYGFYALFGTIALACAYGALCALGLEARARAWLAPLASEPRRAVWPLALIAFGASVSFRRIVLEDQPIADDESTYLFIARTLLHGRVINPLPDQPDFFRNQFIVMNQHGWFGKYPIGYPLLLAAGEALHLRDVVQPLMAALCVVLTYAVGVRLFDAKRALLGALLLVCSPHFIWTAGTLLSQPTASACLMLGCWAGLVAADGGKLRWFLGSGLAFAWGIAVRPLPGVPFAMVAIACAFAHALRAAPVRRRRAWLGAFALGAASALGGIVILLVNHAQTGDAMSSGYHEYHGHLTLFSNKLAVLFNSLFGGLLRENFWLFGVTLGLVPVLFARPARAAWGFWGMIAAELACRLLSPKTVVSTTGPIYLTEIVPLLTLAAADGLWRLTSKGRVQLLPLMAAGALVACSMFVPVQYATIDRSVYLRGLIFEALRRSGAERALVFSDALVFPTSGASWAYFPDNPSPDLSDDIVFARVPKTDVMRNVQSFWARHFGDRRAFLYLWSPQGEPVFRELERGE
jgi:hypothetical protein